MKNRLLGRLAMIVLMLGLPLLPLAQERMFIRTVAAVSICPGASATTTATVNLRAGPSTDDAVLRVLPAGTQVDVTSGPYHRFWYEVTSSSTTGYVHGDYLTQAPPTFDYAFAMQSAFAHEVNRLDLPHYDLTFQVDPTNRYLNGRVELWFRNTTGRPLSDVVLRLYPNFPADVFGDGGTSRMNVSDVVVQGIATAPGYEAQDTAVRLPLPAPVAPDDLITLALNFQSNIVPRPDGTFPLPSFYPMLAAWQSGWRTDVTLFPDHVYASSGLYHARISVPLDWVAASTGSNLNTVDISNMRTYEVVTGPVRTFAFSVGRYLYATAEQDGTLIVVWYGQNTGLADAAQKTAQHMAASLATYNRYYGPYPYHALECLLILDRKYDASTSGTMYADAHAGSDASAGNMVHTSRQYYGMEYSGLILVYTGGSYTTGMRYVTAHEVAHQWFYGMLGNDIFLEPWLDEAFAQYSPRLVEEAWVGPAAAETYYQYNVLNPAYRATQLAGLSIWEYGAWTSYHRSVYGLGAQFLHTLREQIGDAAFFGGIQRYYAKHKYGIVHKDDFKAAMEVSSGQDLDALFLQWLGR
jgi:hypothetical protein